MSKAAILLIRLFQLTRPFRPAACRFYPSCSSYSLEAIQQHGFLKGILLSVWRICRCQPFCQGGIDEVPVMFSGKRIFCQSEIKEA